MGNIFIGILIGLILYPVAQVLIKKLVKKAEGL